MSESTQLANQAAMHSIAVMEQWGNNEVYNEDRWVERARQAARKTLEGIFELGRALIVLKEHTEHGRFRDIAENELGLHYRETARLMNATRRFATPQMQKAAPKLMDLGKSKLLELLVEEDDALVELTEGGEINGHTLDDVDRMTIKELREALRANKDDLEAARKVSADKDAKINALQEQLEKSKRKKANPKDIAESLKLDLGVIVVAAESEISKLADVFDALIAHAHENDMNHDALMVGALNQIIRDCEMLRERYALPMQPSPDGIPEWLMDNEADAS